MLSEETLYEYKAVVASKYDGVYDGDTIYLDIDLGMFTWKNAQPIRLLDVSAPEVRGEEKEQGFVVRDHVKTLIKPGDEVRVRTIRDKRSFNRWIGIVWFKSDDGAWRSINDVINTFLESMRS
jgi:micrococcal nuclease